MIRVGAALLFLLLSLAGCGFQPQLRDSTGQYDIGIPSIAGRDGQVLRAALVQRLNRFEQPPSCGVDVLPNSVMCDWCDRRWGFPRPFFASSAVSPPSAGSSASSSKSSDVNTTLAGPASCSA